MRPATHGQGQAGSLVACGKRCPPQGQEASLLAPPTAGGTSGRRPAYATHSQGLSPEEVEEVVSVAWESQRGGAALVAGLE